MSSIYKKGRDGYYYYQTYVVNPKSQKKDKRIFHALGTKDKSEALEKQKEFDKIYDGQNGQKNLVMKRLIKYILSGCLTFFLFIFLYENFYDSGNSSNSLSFEMQDTSLLNNDQKIQYFDLTDENKTFQNKTAESVASKSLKINEKEFDSVKLLQPLSVPVFNIERIDTLSGGFKLGKVYVTIDVSTSKESQKILCQKLLERFNDFSNIIICLYANNEAGKNLANGKDELVSIEDQKRYWLAMYSYNSVEGEYFDDKPSSYLGVK